MGNEREGISNIVKEHADEFVKIPMQIFRKLTSVFLQLYALINTTQLRKS